MKITRRVLKVKTEVKLRETEVIFWSIKYLNYNNYNKTKKFYTKNQKQLIEK